MSYGFPNWMFAAIAIAAYELAVWLRHRFQWPEAVWISYGIIAVCAIIMLIRIVVYRIRRHRNQDVSKDDDDDWRNY